MDVTAGNSFTTVWIILMHNVYSFFTCNSAVLHIILQVLDFAAFPKPEFDVPIFCANFFTNASMNIVVL